MKGVAATAMGFLLAGLALAFAVPAGAQKMLSCEMQFSMKGWAVVVTSGRGEGTITCEGGEKIPVTLESKGIGLSAGQADIVEARGVFTGVSKVDDLFGSYASSTRVGGAGSEAGGVARVIKGDVALAIYAKGKGIGISTGIGKLTITRK